VKLRLTSLLMTWDGTEYKISAMQRSPGRREFTATPEGWSGSHVVIDTRAMTMTCDGIEFTLENWRVEGEAVECDTVDPATSDGWVEGLISDIDAGLRGG
jgi:hypothetical protein